MPSLFEAAGNVLDLPGSSIRDLLMMRNPVDQYLTPFSADNRTSGQEMLHSVGMSGDSPWLSAGLEMALDPASLLGLGMIGKAAKTAGLVGKAGKLSALRAAMSTPQSASRAIKAIPGAARNAARRAASGAKRLSLESVLASTAYNPTFRQAAGGAALLESLMRGRELNPYYNQMYDEQSAGIQ